MYDVFMCVCIHTHRHMMNTFITNINIIPKPMPV